MSYKIKFLPFNKEIKIQHDVDLLTASVMAGVQIYNSCGGEGICGRCKVKILKGDFTTDSSLLTSKEKSDGYVLACETNIKSDAEVFVPEEARVEKAEILTSGKVVYTPTDTAEIAPKLFDGKTSDEYSPLSTKLYLELPEPSIDDSTADLERLFREIRKIGGWTTAQLQQNVAQHQVDGRREMVDATMLRPYDATTQLHQNVVASYQRTQEPKNPRTPLDFSPMQMGLANIKKLSSVLRSANFKVTVTLGNRNGTTEVVLVEAGNTANKNFGVAIDIGTTTIVSYLVDLNSQNVLSSKATYNPQISFGEDVITRIIYANEQEGLDRLHHIVIDTLNDLIISHAIENNVSFNDINCILCAGNTTMVHLLLKVNPTNIRRSPYIPVAHSFPVIRAIESGIKINPRGLLSTVPNVSCYVGGDIIAGVLASGMNNFSDLTLFIDLGTNGEVVLGNKDFLVCCSTSAGPCFEGGGIKNGIRAQAGAIETLQIIPPRRDKLQIKTIGNKEPIGICGAGVISIIAELFNHGIIDKSGDFVVDSSVHLVKTEEEIEFRITDKISITQSDIKNFIHSKGAIFTGCEVLLKKMGFGFHNLSRVIIAGGLGNALDIEKSIILGLLPDLPREKFLFIGNGSITGCKMCILSQLAMNEAEAIAQKMTYIDLSCDNEFMNSYTASLFLPHTNKELFPT